MTDAQPDETGAQPMGIPPARVYLDYYQLTEAPFAITPDPGFLYTSGGHQQVLEKIAYAIDSRMGFTLLTGEVGTGKTTVCRTLLDRLSDRAETVYIINPSVSGRELLTGILEDAGIPPESNASKKALIDQLYRHLLSMEAYRPFVVIVDDAQTMTPEALEDLRLLSNLETDKHKLIQVVLSGQPELIDLLDSNRLRQLRQRIAIHCRLATLSASETSAYIARRLFVAGNQGQVGFSPGATRLVFRKSYGIPRLINKICDTALTAGYVNDAPLIDSSHVKRALVELDGLDLRAVPHARRRIGFGIAIILLALVAVTAFTLGDRFLFIEKPIAGPFIAGNPAEGLEPATEPFSPDAGQTASVPAAVALPQIPAEAFPAGGAVVAAEGQTADRAVSAGDITNKEDVTNETEPPPTAPYALQLGSFRTRENATRAVERYRKKEIPAHWQVVGDKQWYRVIAGSFENMVQAGRYGNDHGLKKALIINAPLTVKVIPGQPGVSDADIRRFLSKIECGCLMETGPTGDNVIYTGLYLLVEDASAVARRINDSGRFLAQVVER